MRLRAHEVDGMLEALYGAFRAALTPWESDFVASVQGQWTRRRWLSDRQERVLGEIFEGFASGRRHAGDP